MKEGIEEAQKRLLRKAIEGGEYGLSWWRTCRDPEWVKARGFERIVCRLQWRENQQ